MNHYLVVSYFKHIAFGKRKAANTGILFEIQSLGLMTHTLGSSHNKRSSTIFKLMIAAACIILCKISSLHLQARSQGGGRPPPPQCQKNEGGEERERGGEKIRRANTNFRDNRIWKLDHIQTARICFFIWLTPVLSCHVCIISYWWGKFEIQCKT